MITGTFHERIAELRARTGIGEHLLRGSVTVDQVYAHYQHEHLEFHHPRGGTARYLSIPLEAGYRGWLDEIARTWLDDGGRDAMAHAMEDLSDRVEIQAPREFDDLRHSGHPAVQLGHRTTYDRPPRVHRLSAEELRIKSRIRYMTLPDRLKGWIWWHVQHHTSPPPRHR